MRVSILGVGDLTKIPRFTKISEKDLEKLIEDTAKLLAKKKHEIVIVPDRGIPYEIAKAYKKAGGRKVCGLVPVKDTKYGTEHIKPYLHIIDEKIETETWRDVSSEIAASGEICVVFGISPGVMREVSALKYHKKFFGNKTKLVWFRNTISAPIHKEIEEEIQISYICSAEELEKIS